MRIGISFSGFSNDFVKKALEALRTAFPEHEFVQGNDITITYDPKIASQFPTPSVARNFIISTNPPRGHIVFAYNDPFYAPDIVHEMQEYLLWQGWDCLPPNYAVSLAREGGKTFVDKPDGYYIILKNGGQIRGPDYAIIECLKLLDPSEIYSTNYPYTKKGEVTYQSPETAPAVLFTPPPVEVKFPTGEISFPAVQISLPSSASAKLLPGEAKETLLLFLAGALLLGIFYYVARSERK